MMLPDYSAAQQTHRAIMQRADRIAQTLKERARQLGESDLGSGRDYAFACAHNWLGQHWMSAQQNAAAQEIKRLQRREFRVHGIARAMVNRVWSAYDAELTAYSAAQSRRPAGNLTGRLLSA